METELSRRALDLARRAEKYAAPTNTGFLTPAEQAELDAFCRMIAGTEFPARWNEYSRITMEILDKARQDMGIVFPVEEPV